MDNLMLKSSLLCVFMKIGAENRLYSFKEVLGLFKSYIFANKHLLDPENHSKVICKGDILGKALGVDSFCVEEAKALLTKCVFRLPMPENLRKANAANDSSRPSTSNCYKSSPPNTSSPCRNSSCCFPIIIPRPEEPKYISGPETDFSYQGYETTLCEDDYEAESYHSSSEAEVAPSIDDNEEYEPVTDFDDYQSVNHTDSDADSFGSGIFVLDKSDYFNEDGFADKSDDVVESDHSSLEDESDKWMCVTCGIKNRPYMRFCLKCWKERKEWFPTRPTQKKRRKPRPPKTSRTPDTRAPSSTAESCSSQDYGGICSSQDTQIAGSQDSAAMSISQDYNAESVTDDLLQRGSTFDTCETVSSQEYVASGKSASSMECSSRIRSRDSDTEAPPSKYRKVFAPRDLRQVAYKFRKFCSTSKGERWCKSADAEGLRRRLESVMSDSEIEQVVAKFHRFSASDNGRKWLESSQSSQLLTSLADISTDSDTPKGSERNCSICCSKIANASLVHGRISHLGFCYVCAKRLYNTKSRCPACRRKIDRITKICYV